MFAQGDRPNFGLTAVVLNEPERDPEQSV